MSLTAGVPGTEKLLERFGRWPSFLDAEVTEVRLSRRGPSLVRMICWDISPRIGSRDFLKPGTYAEVEFRFDGLVHLTMSGFGSRNIISSLDIRKTDRGYRLVIAPSDGFSAAIEAETMEVDLPPPVRL